MESLSNARRVYKPSEPTAASNVEMMVKVVEDPAYWGLANGLIGVCLAGVKSPKSTRIVHELDAVFNNADFHLEVAIQRLGETRCNTL